MRLYRLRDGANEAAGTLAYLECYERPRAYFFELAPDADAWDLPFILHEFAQRGMRTIDATWSRRWVESRLVPPERQNLGEVLRTNGLETYDELRLLELTGGRCSQDACYLVPAGSEQPSAWYGQRVASRLADVYAIGGFGLLSVFGDGEVRVCSARELLGGRRPFARVLSDEAVFARVALQAGGHGAQWGEALAAPCAELREAGTLLPLDPDDLRSLIGQSVCDTAEAAQMLGCSRQNVSDLVRRGKLPVLKAGPRGTLFLRADVLARRP